MEPCTSTERWCLKSKTLHSGGAVGLTQRNSSSREPCDVSRSNRCKNHPIVSAHFDYGSAEQSVSFTE